MCPDVRVMTQSWWKKNWLKGQSSLHRHPNNNTFHKITIILQHNSELCPFSAHAKVHCGQSANTLTREG